MTSMVKGASTGIGSRTFAAGELDGVAEDGNLTSLLWGCLCQLRSICWRLPGLAELMTIIESVLGWIVLGVSM